MEIAGSSNLRASSPTSRPKDDKLPGGDHAQSPLALLPDDALQGIFEMFLGSWQPWVPWAPVGWVPRTPEYLVSPGAASGTLSTSDRAWVKQEDFNSLRLSICLVCRRWQRVAEGTPSLWMSLFAASASHRASTAASGLRRTSEVSIFGCGRQQMTLAQRASVPLSLRSTRETLVQRSERDTQTEPQGVAGFLARWAGRHGMHLKFLSLAGCGAWVDDKVLGMLAGRCGARMLSLDLCGCRHLSDGAVATAVAAAPELRSLSLAMMGQLSGGALGGDCEPTTTLERGPRLESLDLTGCGGISYCTLERALCRGDWLSGALVGGQLIDLSLRGHVAIPAHGIEAVVRQCPGLVKLDLSCCLAVNDETVEFVASLCPALKILALSGCPAVEMRRRTVVKVAAALGGLRALSLSGCLELCPHESLPALLALLPSLEELDLNHCSQCHPVQVWSALTAPETLAARNRTGEKPFAAMLTLRLHPMSDPRVLPDWDCTTPLACMRVNLHTPTP